MPVDRLDSGGLFSAGRSHRGLADRLVRRPLTAASLVGIAAFVAAGCGSSSSPTATPSSTTAAGSTPTAASAAPTSASSSSTSAASQATSASTVTVRLTDFKLALSRSNLTAGTYTFVGVNAGHTVHALEINGPGVIDRRTPGDLQPGQSARLTVTLSDGTYDLYCPVGDHKQLGMNFSLTVAGAGVAAATATTGPTPSVTLPPSGPVPATTGGPPAATAAPPVTAPRVTAPPVTAVVVTPPPVTAPRIIAPPVTAPIVTSPPVTAPRVTAPPVTAPPATAAPPTTAPGGGPAY